MTRGHAANHGVENPRIYSREYYQRIRDLEERHWWYLGMSAIASRLLAARPPALPAPRILDAGCGTGATMAWAQAVLGALHVTGVDVSAHALSFCRDRGSTRLSQASVMDLPFRDGSFDVVLCNDVLQHLPTDGGDVRAILEVHRVLGPGGILLVRTNARPVARRRAEWVDPDFQQYRLDEVVARMRSAGFLVTSASYVNVLPSLHATLREWRRRPPATGHHAGPGSGHGLYQGLAIREAVLRQPWLNRLLIALLAMEGRYLAATGGRLPFGNSIMCLGVKEP